MKVAIGTTNPAKVQAIQKAFREHYKEAAIPAISRNESICE